MKAYFGNAKGIVVGYWQNCEHCLALPFPATPQAARACLGPAMTPQHFAEHGNPTQSQCLFPPSLKAQVCVCVCLCVYVQKEKQVCKSMKYLFNVSMAISEKN